MTKDERIERLELIVLKLIECQRDPCSYLLPSALEEIKEEIEREHKEGDEP
jgi:hypothetical protein